MVDAPASHLVGLNESAGATTVAGGASFAALVADANTYAAASKDAVFAPAQSPSWIATWLRNVRPDGLLMTIGDGRHAVLSIALEIEKIGPFRVARLMGGGHANGNFPPTSRNLARTHHETAMALLIDQIGRHRPDIDLLALERLAPEWLGLTNPFRVLPHTVSPNIALAVDLSGGFDAVLRRAHGSKKKKKHRYQLRRLQAVGDMRQVRASSPQEAHALLDTFFEMKSSRLKRIGVANVFGNAKVQAFFHDLFAEAATDAQPAFVLNALEVGGKVRAVTGSSLSGDRLICDFAAIADDDVAAASPGDYLFFENIDAACRDGCAIYDFGVGDEPYKRSWCNIETEHFDVWVPLTTRGRLLAATLSAKARLKAQVKRSPWAWRLWKALRGRLGRSGSTE